MYFNTFEHIKADKYCQFDLFNPVNWFQFVDDVVVITGKESENRGVFQIASHSMSILRHDNQN